MTTATLPAACSVDLTKGLKAAALVELLQPIIKSAGDCVYWTSVSSWGASNRLTVRPRGGQVITTSLAPGGNEGFHVTVMAYLYLQGGVIEDPQWLPICTSKVFTIEDGIKVTAAILQATADLFIW